MKVYHLIIYKEASKLSIIKEKIHNELAASIYVFYI